MIAVLTFVVLVTAGVGITLAIVVLAVANRDLRQRAAAAERVAGIAVHALTAAANDLQTDPSTRAQLAAYLRDMRQTIEEWSA